MDIVPEENTQYNLFTKFDHSRYNKLMKAYDKINSVWGCKTVRSATSGFARPGGINRAKLSQRYTTNWDEILKIVDPESF